MTIRDARGRADVRRFALARRANGTFARRPAYQRRDGCGVLRNFKLLRPAFGGRGNRALGIAFRLSEERQATVTVLRGDRVVRRYRAVSRRAGVTHRLRLPSEPLARGTYRVRLALAGPGGTSTATLAAQRL
jgi:hypothetical protein